MSKQYYDENGNPVEIQERKKRGGCLKWIGIFFGLIILFGACGALLSEDTENTTEPDTEQVAEDKENEESTEESEEKEQAEETVEEDSEEETVEEDPEDETTEEDSEEETVEEDPEEDETTEEDDVPREHQNALKSAQNYVDMMHFSEAGLYDQLTSEYGESYPAEAAQYAIENVDVDYNEEALEAAQSYQEIMPMSDQGLFDQLTSEYGEQFTEEQAQYAIDNLD